LWLSQRRRGLARLIPMVLLSLVAAGIVGCGAGRVLPEGATTTNPDPTPTPDGTYTLVVTGTASGISHSVQLTLTVK
jgi:hypothetical protein